MDKTPNSTFTYSNCEKVALNVPNAVTVNGKSFSVTVRLVQGYVNGVFVEISAAIPLPADTIELMLTSHICQCCYTE